MEGGISLQDDVSVGALTCDFCFLISGSQHFALLLELVEMLDDGSRVVERATAQIVCVRFNFN
jgi:hypothetical protein